MGRRTALRSSRRRAALLACAASAAGLVASSQVRAAGSIDSIAQETAQGLGTVPASVVVVAAPLVTDQPAPRGDEMALRVAALVAGRLGAGARVHPQVAQLATARAIAGRASALVFVQSEIARGDVRTTLDVYRSMANAWDRIRNPLPSPASHAFASAKIDAEVRAYLTPLLLEQASVHRISHDERDVLSVACGDVDGDGGNELVLVSRARVAMGRARDGKFTPERTAEWTALSPRAPVPMREPLAGAVITTGAVHVGTTDRAGLTLTPDFAGHTILSGIPAASSEGLVCLRPNPSAGAFDGAPVGCAWSHDIKPKLAVPAPRFDGFASSTIVDAAGGAHTITAIREPSGSLKIKTADTAAAPDGDFGAQLAIGDLDQDGTVEIATSDDTSGDDAVSVLSWAPAGSAPELRLRLRLPAPGGVRALAVCPPEDGGEPALVAVVGPEVWLIRASKPSDGR